MGKKSAPEIRNKNVRSMMYMKLKKEKLTSKKKSKKEENKDKPKQIQKTIENCRVIDETYVNNINDDELILDFDNDELSTHLDPNSNDPKVLITTNNMKSSLRTYKFCRELSKILPNANYFHRKNVKITKVIPEAVKRGYSAIMLVNEDAKIPNGIVISLLPEGPTMHFKLSSLKLTDEIKNGGDFTRHKPEIIINNFNTRLGLQVGRALTALFPHDPQYEGRHVITFHNQRDFIFVRHHRYIFKDAAKVGIQELGPRFTLKLRSLQKGVFASKFGEYEWILKRHEQEQSRRKFAL
jgi:ribosome production factor 1